MTHFVINNFPTSPLSASIAINKILLLSDGATRLSSVPAVAWSGSSIASLVYPRPSGVWMGCRELPSDLRFRRVNRSDIEPVIRGRSHRTCQKR
jgi:hypothetical protein